MLTACDKLIEYYNCASELTYRVTQYGCHSLSPLCPLLLGQALVGISHDPTPEQQNILLKRHYSTALVQAIMFVPNHQCLVIRQACVDNDTDIGKLLFQFHESLASMVTPYSFKRVATFKQVLLVYVTGQMVGDVNSEAVEHNPMLTKTNFQLFYMGLVYWTHQSLLWRTGQKINRYCHSAVTSCFFANIEELHWVYTNV